MLQNSLLRERIIKRFDTMSPQLKQAARYILEHPQETALVSMRELSRHAGVQPSTMTRLAKFLDLSGYDEIRTHHAEAIRSGATGLSARIMHESDPANAMTGASLARQMFQSLSAQIARLCEDDSLSRLDAVADRLAKARRIFVLGLRSCHSVAWHFHYVMSLLGDRTYHLDGPAGTGSDGLMHACRDDVLLVVSINPYALQSIELAQFARDKGVGILAITDSEVSPLVGISEHAVLCSTDSQSFFHTLTPALAVSEVLCGLLASKDRSAALEALKQADHHLLSLDTYTNAIPPRRI